MPPSFMNCGESGLGAHDPACQLSLGYEPRILKDAVNSALQGGGDPEHRTQTESEWLKPQKDFFSDLLDGCSGAPQTLGLGICYEHVGTQYKLTRETFEYHGGRTLVVETRTPYSLYKAGWGFSLIAVINKPIQMWPNSERALAPSSTAVHLYRGGKEVHSWNDWYFG